jgi:hypothetical protein
MPLDVDTILDSYSKKHLCCGKNKTITRLKNVKTWIDENTDLNIAEKELLFLRYTEILHKFEKQYKSNSKYYIYSTIFTNITSLLVTGIISLQDAYCVEDVSDPASALWWLSWLLSLSVSIITTISAFYKWDRKYILLFTLYTKLEQELWMFIEQVGHYRCENELTKHSDHLNYFFARIEIMNRRLNDNLASIEDKDDDSFNKKNKESSASSVTSDIETDRPRTPNILRPLDIHTQLSPTTILASNLPPTPRLGTPPRSRAQSPPHSPGVSMVITRRSPASSSLTSSSQHSSLFVETM